MPSQVSELFARRRAAGGRSTIRHVLCMDPDARARLATLTAERDALYADDGTPVGDVRLGSDLDRRIAAAEAEVRDTLVTVVLRRPAPAVEDECVARIKATDANDDPALCALSIELILACFDHFELAGQPADGTVDDLRDAFDGDLFERREIDQLASGLLSRFAPSDDLPKSLTQYALTGGDAAK